MRTLEKLKKSLCLVLVLVMMLGLCAINVSATSFTDDEDIGANYKEAAEVLTYIGVFTGQDDGNFDPDVALKRKDACHLVTRLLNVDLGGRTGSTPFTDVADADKAVVAYMASQGITNGYEDNTFRPDNALTGAMFAKFLLVALGYNAAIEGMTGDSWDVYTQNLTDEIGLAKGIPGYDKSAIITREQAAQMCLNALQADMVYYTGGVHVETGDANVTVNATRWPVDYRSNGSSGGYLSSNNDGIMQLCEAKWPDLRLNKSYNNATDVENMNTPRARVWRYKTVEVCTVYADPIWSSEGDKVNKSTISSDLSGYYIDFGGTDHRYITDGREWTTGTSSKAIVSVNGALLGQVEDAIAKATFSINDTSDGLLTFKNDGATMASAIADMTENGRLVELYATDEDNPDEITAIVITCYTLAKVNDVSTSNGTTTYKFSAVTGGSNTNMSERKVYTDTPHDNGVIIEGALAKNDYVTLTYSGDTLGPSTKLYACPTTVYTGEQTSRSNKDTVIIDGTTYAIATGVSKNATTYSGSGKANLLKTGATEDFANGKGDFIFDQYGYLVWSTPTSKSTDYAFIVNVAAKFDDGGLDADTPNITVRAVLSDGTIGDYKVVTQDKDSLTGNGYYASAELTSDSASFSYSSDSAAKGSAAKITVIKNTNIVVGKGNTLGSVTVGSNSVGGGDTTVDAQAKLLMSDIYGYVYRYSINDKGEIELTPILDDAGYNGYDAVGSLTKDPNTAYVGQTTVNSVGRNTLSYMGQQRADKYGKPNNILGTTTTDKVLVGSNTTIIVYNSDKPKDAPVVYKGINSLPSGTNGLNLGVGYYVAKTGGNTSAGEATLTADVVFIAKAGAMSTGATKEYIYVDSGTMRRAAENGSDVYYYKAWHQDGSTFEVSNGNNTLSNSGLYYIDENNKITNDGRIAEKDIASAVIGSSSTDTVVYAGSAAVNGNIIGGRYEKDDSTVTIVIANNGRTKGEVQNGANLILVLNEENGAPTTRIKTIYVVADGYDSNSDD